MLFTAYPERALLLAALDVGVRGFILKEAPLEELLRAIRIVAGGGSYIDPSLAGVLAGPAANERMLTLTKRERDVLRLLSEGMRDEQAGRTLLISPLTVRTHVQHAMAKLKCDTRTQAVAVALRESLIDEGSLSVGEPGRRARDPPWHCEVPRGVPRASTSDDGWRVSDALWERIEPLLPARPGHPLGCHRRRVPDRDALDAILLCCGAGASGRRSTTRGSARVIGLSAFPGVGAGGVFEALWTQLLADPQTTLEWDWLALDSEIVKAPKGGQASGPNPTDRAKSGTKRSLCTDAGGVPLSVAIDGANRHDVKLLERTLEGLLAAPPEGLRPGLCLDRGYDYPWVRPRLAELATSPRALTRRRGAAHPRRRPSTALARRKTFAWLVLFRRLKISHERLATTRSAFLNLACALITWRASNPVTRSEAAY